MAKDDIQDQLTHRLALWGRDNRGWWSHMDESGPPDKPWAYHVGPIVGYGRSWDEAAWNCADGLVEEGWPDDRPHERPSHLRPVDSE